jgi:hypothetical protein
MDSKNTTKEARKPEAAIRPPPNREKKKEKGSGKAPQSKTAGDVIGQIITMCADMKQDDKIIVAKAVAGIAGLVALFPSQIDGKKKDKTAPKGGSDQTKEKKGPKKEPPPPNPMKNSQTYRDFESARRELLQRKKELGQDLDPADPIMIAYKANLDAWNSFRKELQE